MVLSSASRSRFGVIVGLRSLTDVAIFGELEWVLLAAAIGVCWCVCVCKKNFVYCLCTVCSSGSKRQWLNGYPDAVWCVV